MENKPCCSQLLSFHPHPRAYLLWSWAQCGATQRQMCAPRALRWCAQQPPAVHSPSAGHSCSAAPEAAEKHPSRGGQEGAGTPAAAGNTFQAFTSGSRSREGHPVWPDTANVLGKFTDVFQRSHCTQSSRVKIENTTGEQSHSKRGGIITPPIFSSSFQGVKLERVLKLSCKNLHLVCVFLNCVPQKHMSHILTQYAKKKPTTQKY